MEAIPPEELQGDSETRLDYIGEKKIEYFIDGKLVFARDIIPMMLAYLSNKAGKQIVGFDIMGYDLPRQIGNSRKPEITVVFGAVFPNERPEGDN